jgi:hypothetical protein
MARNFAGGTLVWFYSNTSACAFERVYWFLKNERAEARARLSWFIRTQLDVLYEQERKAFDTAQYPDLATELLHSEGDVFLAAIGAPPGSETAFDAGSRAFRGVRAVIEHRLAGGSEEQLKRAADLFNYLVEFGLSHSGAMSNAFVEIGSVEEIAPTLIDTICDNMEENSTDARRLAATMKPFLPMIRMLRESVRRRGWSEDDFAVETLRWIYDMYSADERMSATA